jgi:hypothetical protein
MTEDMRQVFDPHSRQQNVCSIQKAEAEKKGFQIAHYVH